jgi:hypothetical protein
MGTLNGVPVPILAVKLVPQLQKHVVVRLTHALSEGHSVPPQSGLNVAWNCPLVGSVILIGAALIPDAICVHGHVLLYKAHWYVAAHVVGLQLYVGLNVIGVPALKLLTDP